jgi:hypothetical protein
MKKIMIVCQCATNKGDRAIAEYLISKLLREDVFITLSTTEPNLWKNPDVKKIKIIGPGYQSLFNKTKNRIVKKIYHELTNFYYKAFVYPELIQKAEKRKCEKISKSFISELNSADFVIVTGGHHITSIRNKNALFSITYDIALTSIYSKRYILWSQTIGPLSFDNEKVEKFFGDIIRKAAAVFIRDDNSKQCLEKLVGKNQENIFKSYDSVFGFGNGQYKSFHERENKVGISIFNGLKKAFHTYSAIAKVLDYFVLKGNAIEFFRMEYDSGELKDIQSIISLMKEKGEIKIYPFETRTEEHLQELSSCKYYIGYKTHSVIMALTTATPLIGICYHKKTFDFMNDYGLGKYAISDENFDVEDALRLTEEVIEKANDLHKLMVEKSKMIATSIEDSLLGVIHEQSNL